MLQWGSICATHALRATFTTGFPGMGWLYRLMPLRRAKPWVQDLRKNSFVLPYLAPPKVKMHKMAPWKQPPP